MEVYSQQFTVFRLVVVAVFVCLPSIAGVSADTDPAAAGKIDASNWTEVVGFAPDLSEVKGFEAGKLLDSSNWEEASAWIPPGIELLIREYGLKIRTAPYRPIHPSMGYLEATQTNLGKTKAVDTGDSIRNKGIRGYEAGLPFPNPRTGLEVAWDNHFSYAGDDGGLDFGVFWVCAKRGVHRTEEWTWRYITRATHRTDLDPRPAIEWFADKGVQYASLARALKPYDKAGTMALFYRFEEPLDQRGYLYVPSMRRTIKMVFGTPGVPWNKTDMLYEDVRGYAGYAEWSTWKLIGTMTILAPMHAGVKTGRHAAASTFDFEEPPHWNPSMDWEPRPVYVVEAKSKFWTCPYEKVVLYVDAEMFYIPIKEAWDEDGRLWKVFINAYNESPDMDTLPPPIALTVAIDVKKEHATAFPTYKVFSNVGLSRTMFTETAIRRGGK